jgi:hypothetical protein
MAIKDAPSCIRGGSSIVRTPAIAKHEAQVQDRTRAIMQEAKKPTWDTNIAPKKPTPPQW